jgi:predicted transposase YdaD
MHELSEVRAMLSERVKEWTQQWEQQGLLRGRLEGRREGLNAERFLLARQAKRRFGAAIAAQFELSIAIIDDSEQLSLIGEWLIDCNTGKELLQQVEQFVKQAPTK